MALVLEVPIPFDFDVPAFFPMEVLELYLFFEVSIHTYTTQTNISDCTHT